MRGVLASALRDSKSRRSAVSEVAHLSGDVNADERAVKRRAKSTPRWTQPRGWPARPYAARVPNAGLSSRVLYALDRTACNSHRISTKSEDSIKTSSRDVGPEENDPGARERRLKGSRVIRSEQAPVYCTVRWCVVEGKDPRSAGYAAAGPHEKCHALTFRSPAAGSRKVWQTLCKRRARARNTAKPRPGRSVRRSSDDKTCQGFASLVGQ